MFMVYAILCFYYAIYYLLAIVHVRISEYLCTRKSNKRVIKIIKVRKGQ